MNEHTLRVLEFNSILSLLKGHVTSYLGESLCESLKPISDIKEIETLLDEVSELKEILQNYGDIPIGGVMDVEESIKKTRVEGFVLDPTEIIDIFSTLNATHRLKGFFEKLGGDWYPLTKGIAKCLIDLPEVERRIRKTVGDRGDILDSASPKLNRIRQEIKSCKAKIHSYLEGLFANSLFQPFFQEKIITIRNGRYVIPVKSDFKGHIQGIIHDHSHSKATCFIEPLFTIELNNELGILSKEEKDEEIRVLRELTSHIQANANEILSNLRALGKVDLTFAKAKFSIDLHAIRPVLNEEMHVNLINAYHPLLLSFKDGYKNKDKPVNLTNDVVPIDIHFSKRCNTLIITGANTGGKTVALKTIGILTLMVQAGMHIPVKDGSSVAIFDSIFADVGDEQDIEQNISTFSSHILQIVEILEKADERSLVLLDEIGVGTDPDEGAALSMALLDYLREKKASIITTTHLNLLKAYAYLHEDVTNVSVAFNSETMEPLYRLVYGASGESNALVIAKKLGIPREILNRASGFLAESNKGISNLIGALEKTQKEVIKEKEEIKRLKEIHIVYQKQLDSLLDQINKKKERLLIEVEAEVESLLNNVEHEAKEILKDVKKNGRAFSKVKEGLNEIKEKFESYRPKRDKKPFSVPQVGDFVKISPLNKEGVIFSMHGGADKVEVLIGDLKVKVDISDLEQASLDKKVHNYRATGNRSRGYDIWKEVFVDSTVSEMLGKVNVVGLRVEEAILLVDKAIDNAVLHGITRLDIVHGIGTGRLREAIRGHLKLHNYIDNYRAADLSQGGAGVTIADVKA
ncbi:MAG: endonuclease MutS2 [Thermodesulfobacteriota bacterium]|nr:endonuclease MutS2 [Thermodesulfobacteriota bacterium]